MSRFPHIAGKSGCAILCPKGMSLLQMLSIGDGTVHGVSAGCEASNTTRLHPHIHGRVPLLAPHPRGQLLEGSCQASAASGQHSLSGRQHFP